MSQDNVVKHLIMPGFEKDQCPILLERESLADFLVRSEWEFSLPTICVLNGAPVMRSAWATTTISQADEVLFYSRPYGGQNGNKARTVLSLVAIVALAAFAPWAAGAVFAAGTFGFYATVSAITLAGGFLVNTFLAPKAAANDGEKINQIYSLSAGGNTASPFQTIPVQYGRLKQFPPYAAIPWSDFVGNDSYLNVLLATGQGKYDLEKIFIDDTILWDSVTGVSASFSNVTIQICDPGEEFTLFPSNVVTAAEISGQEVTDTPLGYYTINPSGTQIDKVFIDFVLPAGAQYKDSKGRTRATTIHLYAYLQEIDDAGTPIGSETAIMSAYPLTYNTVQPTRFTFATGAIGPGRYQVKIYRSPSTWEDTDTSGSSHDTITDLIQAVSVRGYVVGTSTFVNSSVVGIRLKASAQLSQNSAKKFGVIQTRILPVWNGTDFVDEPTQNAWWAFYDAATNDTYGAKWPLSKVDFQTIVDQAAAADVRGDTFNYRFDSAVTYQQAFDVILASNRAKVTWLGDVLSATRDEWKPIPQMLISDQQIIRSSLEVDYQLNSEDNSDCVQGQFLNEQTWQPAQLQYPPNSEDFTATTPAQLQIDGVTDQDQFYRELRFLYKQSQLRRIKLRLETEHDGRLLRFGSVVKVQSHMPKKWGVSGEVKSYNTGTRVLTLNRTVTPDPDLEDTYIELRSKTGGYFGPVLCSVGSPENLVALDAADLASVESDLGITISDALDRMDGAEPPAFVFGKAGNLSRNCIVLSGKPNGHKVSLEMAVDNFDVHDDTNPDVPAIPTPPTYSDPRVPIISGLVASFRQGVSEPQLSATWFPAKGALYYKAQISYDSGETWTTLVDGLNDPNLTAIVSYSNLRLRVAGIGQLQGPYSSVDVTAPDIVQILPINAGNLGDGLHEYVMNRLKDGIDDLRLLIQQAASVAQEADTAAVRNTQILRQVSTNGYALVQTVSAAFADFQTSYATYQVTVEAHFTSSDASIAANGVAITANTASIVSNTTALATLNTSYAAYQVTVNASLGTLTSSVTTNSSAIATVGGQVNAMYSLVLDVNGYVTGFQSTNNGTTSVFQVIADKFIVAKPGVSGGTAIAVFAIGTVGGSPSLVFNGNMYADGDILARHIGALQVTTAKLDAGAVTAAKIQTGTITSASGVIGALGVDALSIADQAVTVPAVQSISTSVISGTIGTVTLSINTAGLSGKSITIFCICPLTFSGGAFATTYQLTMNGSLVQSAAATNVPITLSGCIQITGTGGTMSITCSVAIYAAGAITTSGTIYAVAAKR